ncbi:MAG: tetratricopeptide repeat protein, partial [Terricaulis sp.]
ASLAELSPEDEARKGLVFMQKQDFASACEVFSALQAAHPGDPALRFNYAWSLAMGKDFDGALQLLDSATSQALPQAAALQVELMHNQGLFLEAGELARSLIERHPNHSGLLAAASVLAIDNEDLDAAVDYARRAGDHPDALTTLGVLALDTDRGGEAASLFARALEQKSTSPRAWIGSGLSRMLSGDHAAAAHDLTHGAEIFATHVGSWIGAGFAHLLAGDLAKARLMFERALALDHNFAESHGSLAVIDVLEGNIADARRGAETARRLDGASFSAALASALIASADQRPELAQMIIEKALHTPIDQNGRTIAQSLARLGLSN